MSPNRDFPPESGQSVSRLPLSEASMCSTPEILKAAQIHSRAATGSAANPAILDKQRLQATAATPVPDDAVLSRSRSMAHQAAHDRTPFQASTSGHRQPPVRQTNSTASGCLAIGSAVVWIDPRQPHVRRPTQAEPSRNGRSTDLLKLDFCRLPIKSAPNHFCSRTN